MIASQSLPTLGQEPSVGRLLHTPERRQGMTLWCCPAREWCHLHCWQRYRNWCHSMEQYTARHGHPDTESNIISNMERWAVLLCACLYNVLYRRDILQKWTKALKDGVPDMKKAAGFVDITDAYIVYYSGNHCICIQRKLCQQSWLQLFKDAQHHWTGFCLTRC